MALDIYLPDGTDRLAAIDDDGEHIVAKLPDELGLRAPQCKRIWDRFYEHPHLHSPAEVAQWRAELIAIRAAAGKRARPRTLAICDELVAACDHAIARNTGLRLESD